MARSQARMSKGSQEVVKELVELPMSFVLNPNEGMNSVPPLNDIPFGELTMRIGTRWLGGWHRARMERHPYLPPPLPCTEGYMTQFFPPFFQTVLKSIFPHLFSTTRSKP